MTKKDKANGSFFGNFLYEQILSQRLHFLKDLAQVVDFRFVAEHCKDFYVAWEQARSRGFITGRLHIIDSTHITARVDLFRWKKEYKGKDKGDDDDRYVGRYSPDPDARSGRKSKKKSFYGYKAHKVEDADSKFFVQVKTTPGNVHDGTQLPAPVDGRAGEATGDKAYDSEVNHTHLAAVGVTSGIIRRQRRPGRPRNSCRERLKIGRNFSEGKNRHGLDKARYWGLAKVKEYPNRRPANFTGFMRDTHAVFTR